MTALKLFISHSSRLDDVEHPPSRADHNWRLLEDSCHAIRDYYGDRVEVLVDSDGLIPGEDWNHQLNLWLAECHVAIILFSERAITNSDWVAKEAAILSWRAEIDPDFTLIPVLLDGQASPEDLQREFAGTLQIGTNQCIRNAATAADVLAGVRAKLGDKKALATSHPQTPLEQLQGGIAKLLADGTTSASLEAALATLNCPAAPNGTPQKNHYARQLALRLINPPESEPESCLQDFTDTFVALSPAPMKEDAQRLLKAVRPLWVNPAAASYFSRAFDYQYPIVLAGTKLHSADFDLDTEHYTLDRYLERAWRGSRDWLLVTVTVKDSIEYICERIREKAHTPMAIKTSKPAKLDERINKGSTYPVLVVATNADSGGLPDARQLPELQKLQSVYPKLIIVLTVEPDHGPLPASMVLVKPPLDPEIEENAYLDEGRACMTLKRNYGSCV